jgi:hypothetical protein
MTPEEFTRTLPKITGNSLTMKPPFVFNGLSARVFPLRAQLDTLQRLCDDLLNFVPPQAGYFRAPVPYVYLMVLDYGQIAEAAARVGWIAQIEVFFMVPVEWYKWVGGKWEFHNWAVITPYVFVDDDYSVPLGRTVYGFPKVLASVLRTPSSWVKNATAPVTLASISTDVFPQAYVGTNMESRTFLKIERDTASGTQMPFNPAAGMMPWTIASNLAQSIAGFSRDASRLAQAMRISSINPSNPGMFQEMLARMAPWFLPGGTGFVQNSINLKQFRRSNKPAEICYQSLTNGCMEMMAFNGGGLLGEYATMLGDLSGGHSIKLYDYPSLPIARTLGLEVHRQWEGPEGKVAELKPVVPFWIDVDVKYDAGVNLAWRTNDGIWKDASGVRFDLKPSAKAPEPPHFNTTITTAIDEIAGPFEYSNATVRVLPLLAHGAKLQHHVDEYLNVPLGTPMKGLDGKKERVRFKIWARNSPADQPDGPPGSDLAYVYLMVTSFDSIISLTNNIGNWTKYQLSFMIPVEFQRQNASGTWDLVGVGLVPAFSFADNCIAAIARLEVEGFEASVANFSRPESVWLSNQEAFSDKPLQTLLRVDAEVVSALSEGQKATVQPVIEIIEGDPHAGLGSSSDAPWRWSESLREELLAKKLIKANKPGDLQIGRALALELLGNQMPVNAYSMKQFRDVADPARACYQSLVRVPRLIKELCDVREIEETLVVKIHDYPTLDIVDRLGLVATALPAGATGIVSTVQAVRPFYVVGTLQEPLAQRLGWRCPGAEWVLDGEVAFSTILSDQKGAPPITADFLAEALQDQMDPCHISEIIYQAAQRRGLDAAQRTAQQATAFSKAEARKALGRIDAQAVIESMLSREWGNADPDTRWRAGRRQLMTALSSLPVNGVTSAFAETVLYRQLNNELAIPPGAVASPLKQVGKYLKDLGAAIDRLAKEKPANAKQRWRSQIERIILAQEKFTRLRMDMDNDINVLAAAAILAPQDLEHSYADLGQKMPTNEQFAQVIFNLIETLRSISAQEIQGEPSERNNLDAHVRADQKRLQILLKAFPNVPIVDPVLAAAPAPPEDILAWAKDHIDEFRNLVALARGFCDVQTEALLNKLSRAYQKPDFCIRRDSVGPESDQLLPLSLSWDADWYYGRDVKPDPAKPAPVKAASGADSGGKQ